MVRLREGVLRVTVRERSMEPPDLLESEGRRMTVLPERLRDTPSERERVSPDRLDERDTLETERGTPRSTELR